MSTLLASVIFQFLSTNDTVLWGGSEELWSQAAAGLVRRGHTVSASVWDHSPEPPVVSRLRQQGVQIHKRYERVVSRNRLEQAWATLVHGAPASRISNEEGFLMSIDADLVVFSVGYQYCPKFLRMSKVLRARNVPYAVVVQLVIEGLAVPDASMSGYAEAYNGAQQVWFVSQQNREATEREFANTFTNASLVFNPVDLQVSRPPYPSEAGGLSLALVGALTPHHKGQDLVIEVLARPHWRERELHVAFYGEGASRDTLQRAVRRHGLQRVSFAGHVGDKSAIWSKHHAALSASRMEGRSLALQEAMAHARMAIATDVGGARDLISDGRSGFLVPCPTVDALDHTLCRAWEQRSTWQSMGLAARAQLVAALPPDPVAFFEEAILKTTTPR